MSEEHAAVSVLPVPANIHDHLDSISDTLDDLSLANSRLSRLVRDAYQQGRDLGARLTDISRRLDRLADEAAQAAPWRSKIEFGMSALSASQNALTEQLKAQSALLSKLIDRA